MQTANIVILEGINIPNVTFTGLQWTQFIKDINQSVSDAFTVGLFLGLVAGLVGVFTAFKFWEWYRQYQWEKYGKS